MNKNQRQPVPAKDPESRLAWFQDAVRQFRLAWRLFFDERVPLWTKIIPPLALGYVLFPFDIIMDITPVLGQLDDLAVVLIGLKLFIELSPPTVVREHLEALGARIQEWRVEEGAEADETTEIIEGQYQLQEAKPAKTEEEASPTP
jgi:uncharacterized membrane protein YkvA (DUF1232 family)